MQHILDESPGAVVDFIAHLLSPKVDARIFEIVSFAILKAYIEEIVKHSKIEFNIIDQKV